MSGPGGSYRDGEPSLAEAVDGSGMTTAMAAPAAAVVNRHPQARRPTARRRRARWVAVLLLLAAMGVAGGVTWALFDSNLFAVRSVVVTGTRLVPESEVLAVAGVRPGTPLIRVSTARVAARVLTITQVQGVQVTKTWPDRVVIAVRERTSALAVARPGGGFDLVDANGVIVQSAATRPAGLPIYTTTAAASSLRGDPDVAAAAAVLGELPASLRSSVTSVIVPSPDQVTLSLGSGVTILWGGADDAAAKTRELAILMQTRARSYDVSSPATAVTN
ncbi:MAG: cell division protein FtsQ/DivIB [Streptosporangiaceae bacterium]